MWKYKLTLFVFFLSFLSVIYIQKKPLKSLNLNGLSMFCRFMSYATSGAGKEYGIRKKIFNAYSLNKESLESAFNMFGISDSVFKKKVKEIVEIRHKIVHNNYDGKIENHFDISIIEWITYAMLLKRIGVRNKNIELSLGRIF